MLKGLLRKNSLLQIRLRKSTSAFDLSMKDLLVQFVNKNCRFFSFSKFSHPPSYLCQLRLLSAYLELAQILQIEDYFRDKLGRLKDKSESLPSLSQQYSPIFRTFQSSSSIAFLFIFLEHYFPIGPIQFHFTLFPLCCL